jgi:hypothetical protein
MSALFAISILNLTNHNIVSKNPNNITSPSIREITLLKNGMIIKNEIIRRFLTNFFKTEDFIGTDLTIAIDPKTSAMFAVFDPMALPIARFDSSFIAATKETNISGADVANATTVKPITIRGILTILARDVAPSTKKSDPFIKIKIPTDNKKRDVSIKSCIIVIK